MYNQRRADIRYQQRCKKRQESLKRLQDSIGSIEEIFTYNRIFRAGSKCQSCVSWKASTQAFRRAQFQITYNNYNRVRNIDIYKSLPNLKFQICERGKLRKICAPLIEDRQIHKVICEDVYPKIYHSRMINSNPASLPGKGLSYFQNTIVKMMRKHYNLYGLSGTVIIADIHDFFGSGKHEVIKSYHSKLVTDKQLCKLLDIITSPEIEGEGQNIGYEPAQHEMVYYTTPVDTYMNCQLALGRYGHYMDDFCIFVPPDLDPREILHEFKQKLKTIGLELNDGKTNIIKFGKPFRICKTKFIISNTGKIFIKGSRDVLKRARHKIKSAKLLIAEGKMSYEDLYNIVQNAVAYYDRYDDHNKVLKIRRLVYAIYKIKDTTNIQIYRDYDSLSHAA